METMEKEFIFLHEIPAEQYENIKYSFRYNDYTYKSDITYRQLNTKIIHGINRWFMDSNVGHTIIVGIEEDNYSNPSSTKRDKYIASDKLIETVKQNAIDHIEKFGVVEVTAISQFRTEDDRLLLTFYFEKKNNSEDA